MTYKLVPAPHVALPSKALLEWLRASNLFRRSIGRMPTADLFLMYLWTEGYKIVPLDPAELEEDRR